MPKIGDYSVISAFQATLPKAGTQNWPIKFELSEGTAIRDDAILAFRVLPEKGQGLFTVELNKHEIFKGTFVHVPGSNDFQTVHTVVRGTKKILRANENKLDFIVEGSSGVATFSAPVLWFRRAA